MRSSGRRWTPVSPSSTTAGTITRGRARPGWERPSGKVDGRDRDTAARQIDESIERLGGPVDLLQFHEVIRPGEPDQIFAADGAVHALEAARRDGRTRYVGFTGHKSPDIHLRMLEVARRHDFRFDAVQLPLNVMDAHYESFERKVLPVLVEEEISVLGMKPLGDPFIVESGRVSATECLHYAMNLPVSVVITGIDSRGVLEQALEAARSFRPLSAADVEALLGRAAEAARDGELERYKTSHHFDGTYEHPEWLGPEAAAVAGEA